MKVYLVEDSAEVRDRLVAMLDDIPHVEVVGASDRASEAVSDILRLQPDVAVLDIRLREGNGVDVLKEIRNWVPRTLTIMLTNHASPTVRERCLAAGADHFFDKTAEFDHIRTVLEQPAALPAVRISSAIVTMKRSRPMCGAACPLLEDGIPEAQGWRQKRIPGRAAVADFRHRAAVEIIDGRRSETGCPDLHGILLLDSSGVVHACTEGAARAFGDDREGLAGRPISALVPELRLHAGTPGYNVAYALFWFPSHEWRQVVALGRDGQPFAVEVSISAARIRGAHRLLVALRQPRDTAGATCTAGGDAHACETAV